MAARVFALNDLRAGRLVRPARLSLCSLILAASAAVLPVSPATAATPPGIAASPRGQSIADFYSARGGQPLWLRDGVDSARLLDYLRTADADGLDPGKYQSPQLAKALQGAWGGSPAKVRKADMLLSQAFVAYVRDLKLRNASGMIWVDRELQPKPAGARDILEAAASAPSLDLYLANMGWMHPIYAGLRHALVSGQGGADRQQLRINMERARILPAGKGKYVLVNATTQQLTMYEDGRPVDSMKVVVGKPKNPTPMMAALIRFASLNPYWYVPTDLAAERIAPNVLKEGLPYLKHQGYQVMTNWNDGSSVVDPSVIDWKAVAEGSTEVYIRQLPGRYNAMGEMKFMFPNAEGVYLHDTPQKELLTEASRMFSGGCVRLEDAPRLGRWLFGEALHATSDEAEQRVDLPKPVPVYITYFTVMPSGTELATYPDVYNRDRDQLAQMGGARVAAR
jgi:murein L,D-transpeptidase YcbB/YkuD